MNKLIATGIVTLFLGGFLMSYPAIAQDEDEFFALEQIEKGEISTENNRADCFYESRECMPKGHRGMHNKYRGNRLGLDLTDAQKEAMKSIRLDAARKSKKYRDELRELSAHHKTLVTAETADMKAINNSLGMMSDVKLELAKIKAETTQQIRSQLTEEQLITFDSRRQMRHKARRPHQGMKSMHTGE